MSELAFAVLLGIWLDAAVVSLIRRSILDVCYTIVRRAAGLPT